MKGKKGNYLERLDGIFDKFNRTQNQQFVHFRWTVGRAILKAKLEGEIRFINQGCKDASEHRRRMGETTWTESWFFKSYQLAVKFSQKDVDHLLNKGLGMYDICYLASDVDAVTMEKELKAVEAGTYIKQAARQRARARAKREHDAGVSEERRLSPIIIDVPLERDQVQNAFAKLFGKCRMGQLSIPEVDAAYSEAKRQAGVMA